MAYGQYTEDKPKDCRYCYFWDRKKKGCMLDSCYYQRNVRGKVILQPQGKEFFT
ncbi:hypothetical protein H6B07_16140 [Mediterraneibacter glycyrrhizinilyticus]|nr:hypothetical protein [Mediterraneibacter glycyrrhizinilyticus]MBM6804150.1 hypothetical protein [Mediterraneibacter glycyrrhizinilyticus]